jgi:hypothetical protein
MAQSGKEKDLIANVENIGSRLNLNNDSLYQPNLSSPSSPNMINAKKPSDSQFEMSEILLPAHSTFPQSNSFIGQLMKW